jgi:hypothetical protein
MISGYVPGLIDKEAVCSDENGLAMFERLRCRASDDEKP